MSIRKKRASVPSPAILEDPVEIPVQPSSKQEASEETKAEMAAEAAAAEEAARAAEKPLQAAQAASPISEVEEALEAEETPEAAEAAEAAEAKEASKQKRRERIAPLAIMDDNFSLIDALYRGRHTLLDILASRGYDVERYRKFSPAEAAHASVTSNLSGLSFTTTKVNDPTQVCDVYYTYVSHQMLEKFLRDRVMDEDSERTEVIFVQQPAVTERHHQSALAQFKTSTKANGARRKLRVSFFCIDSLVINPLNHVLVPKHEIVPEEQHKELLASLYVTSKKKLPEIKFHADPIARCIGAVPGDIIKITRPSISAGEAVVYRVCAP